MRYATTHTCNYKCQPNTIRRHVAVEACDQPSQKETRHIDTLKLARGKQARLTYRLSNLENHYLHIGYTYFTNIVQMSYNTNTRHLRLDLRFPLFVHPQPAISRSPKCIFYVICVCQEFCEKAYI